MEPDRCLVIQRDHTILLDTAVPGGAGAREALRGFAELARSVGGYHSYRVTELSLWSAHAAGIDTDEIVATLTRLSVHAVPPALIAFIQEQGARYGLLWLEGEPGALLLRCHDPALLARLAGELELTPDGEGIAVPDERRGWVKSALARRGYPVIDRAALAAAEPLRFELRPGVALRPYQEQAIDRFVRLGSTGGVVLLPCGAGKTFVGVAAAARLGARTLVITPSRTIGEQWTEHFQRLTTLREGEVGDFRRGDPPPPVTIATYHGLTARANGHAGGIAELFDVPWGLIIYDEVHSLPADVFRQSAAMQSRRRLGLTATLVREDGREREVFALVGPPVYAAPWRELEQRGWIAPVDCVEVRLRLPNERAANPARMLAAKVGVARDLVRRHAGDKVLVIAHRLVEVAALARALDAPAVTGETPAAERRARYRAFRAGEIDCLVLSRVANVGVDLPDASVLIQVSGAFGSRQEEAQRVGRLLRPKENGTHATFYSLVGSGTREREFAERRQRFLVDHGYRYRVVDAASPSSGSAFAAGAR